MRAKKRPVDYLNQFIQKKPNGCWLALTSFMWNGETTLSVRRFAYKTAFGKTIKMPKYLKPMCGVGRCVNPEHQEIVSKRYLGCVRVTDEDISAIKKELKKKRSYRVVAKAFNVSYQTCFNIAHGRLRQTTKPR